MCLFSVAYDAKADFVDINTASIVGKNFYYERINQLKTVEYSSIQISLKYSEERNSKAVIYVFNISNQGFIIVSADDDASPILAYDFDQNLTMENPPAAFSEWIQGYADEIEEIRTLHLEGDETINSLWKHLKNSNLSNLIVFNGKNQLPLLSSEWDQGGGYNALCPEDQFGPSGHAYAGCVAVAMAQIMYYYKYPDFGTGSYSYYSSYYGQLSANFGTTNYKWNEMTNKIGSHDSQQIAQLLYHCGVSVDMGYSASGSGAWSNSCVSAYKNYFGYSDGIYISSKSGFSNPQWNTKLIQNLDNKIPLYYHGYPSTGSGAGHAFNLDGYQGADYFHFNWGWSGAYNGYFYLNNLNPGGSDFSAGEGAIFDIKPDTNLYPNYCTSWKNITSLSGVIFDGSGPKNYQDGEDCYWLITPNQTVGHIQLDFDRMDLAASDFITVYDGNSNTDSVLGTFSGQNLPASVSSTGQNLLVRFKSDMSQSADGFDASFKSTMPVYCHGTLNLNTPTGNFSDGSDTNNYNDAVMCRWLIDPQGPQAIILYFTSFKTEQNQDWIKIYDPVQTPSVLLAQYSGNQIPPSITATHGKMLVIFASNGSVNEAGWNAHYYTGNVGMEDELIDNKLRVFPNPAKNVLNIKLEDIDNKNISMKIISIDGKILLEKMSSNISDIQLDISSLKAGLYFINIDNGLKIYRKKVQIF